MVFSGSPFLFYFLPAVLALYFLVPRRLKNPVLLVFSLFFYAWGEPVYVLLMIFSIVMDYALGRWLYVYKEKGNMKAAKRVLVLSVVLNLALLGFFKYTNFLLDTIGSLFRVDIPLLELSLPIGISFYTFQAMSYLIDLYRGADCGADCTAEHGGEGAGRPQGNGGRLFFRHQTVCHRSREKGTAGQHHRCGLDRDIRYGDQHAAGADGMDRRGRLHLPNLF